MKKIILFLTLILALSSCMTNNATKVDTTKNNYINEKYGFSLNFPEEIIYSDNFSADDYIDKEDGEDFEKIAFVYVHIYPERVDLYTIFRMFYINVYEKPYSDVTGEILAETDKYIYTYYDPNYNKQIESSMVQQLYGRFSGYFPSIKDSFKIIEN